MSERLRPSDIRFTQDSIGSRFTDGSYISNTFHDLLFGLKSTDDIDDIEVVQQDGVWWAITGNRRLYVYRRLQDLGVVKTIPVRVRSLSEPGVRNQLNNRRTTDCDGVKAVCRQSKADTRMDQMVKEWRRKLVGRLISPSAHNVHASTEHRFNNTGHVQPSSESSSRYNRERTQVNSTVSTERGLNSTGFVQPSSEWSSCRSSAGCTPPSSEFLSLYNRRLTQVNSTVPTEHGGVTNTGIVLPSSESSSRNNRRLNVVNSSVSTERGSTITGRVQPSSESSSRNNRGLTQVNSSVSTERGSTITGRVQPSSESSSRNNRGLTQVNSSVLTERGSTITGRVQPSSESSSRNNRGLTQVNSSVLTERGSTITGRVQPSSESLSPNIGRLTQVNLATLHEPVYTDRSRLYRTMPSYESTSIGASRPRTHRAESPESNESCCFLRLFCCFRWDCYLLMHLKFNNDFKYINNKLKLKLKRSKVELVPCCVLTLYNIYYFHLNIYMYLI